jgi:hypothetical protein
MKKLAFAITFVLMTIGSTMAQSTRPIPNDLWTGFSLNIPKTVGVEVSSGTLDMVDGIQWGRTFSMTGDTGTFTIAPNHTADMASQSDPSELWSKIAGGAWSMNYKSPKFNGMLFGELTSGTIAWSVNKAGKVVSAEINAEMNIKSGTGSFASAGGPSSFGRFTGTVNYDTNGNPTIVGTMEFLF